MNDCDAVTANYSILDVEVVGSVGALGRSWLTRPSVVPSTHQHTLGWQQSKQESWEISINPVDRRRMGGKDFSTNPTYGVYIIDYRVARPEQRNLGKLILSSEQARAFVDISM